MPGLQSQNHWRSDFLENVNVTALSIHSIDFLILDALYKWLTSGSNAGITGNVGVGPFKASGSAGFGAGPASPTGYNGPVAINGPAEAVVGGEE